MLILLAAMSLSFVWLLLAADESSMTRNLPIKSESLLRRLLPVEDEEAVLCVHEPAAWMTLVLDLIEGSQVPFAGSLFAPEGVVRASVRRCDATREIGAALHCDASALVLDFVAVDGVWRHVRRHVG